MRHPTPHAALQPDQADQAMLDLLHRHAHHPVHLEIDLLTGQVLVGALQLALRHPAFPRATRQIIADFLRAFQAQVAQIDGDLAVLVELGNQPHRDVPTPPCRWCGAALTAHTAQGGAWRCAGGNTAYAPAED